MKYAILAGCDEALERDLSHNLARHHELLEKFLTIFTPTPRVWLDTTPLVTIELQDEKGMINRYWMSSTELRKNIQLHYPYFDYKTHLFRITSPFCNSVLITEAFSEKEALLAYCNKFNPSTMSDMKIELLCFTSQIYVP